MLCVGLAGDDPWSLEAALAYFDDGLIGASQEGFFAGLYRAAALARRYPLSDELAELLERLRTSLDTADVGAARADLRRWLAEETRTVVKRRDQFLPRLEQTAVRHERGDTLPTAELVDFVLILAQTGRAGVATAIETIDARLVGQVRPELAEFYRLEVARGLLDRDATRRGYEASARALCRQPNGISDGDCARLRRRITQLRSDDIPTEGEAP